MQQRKAQRALTDVKHYIAESTYHYIYIFFLIELDITSIGFSTGVGCLI
jgi:hypothetical protein